MGNAEILQQSILSKLDTLTSSVKEFVADYCESFNMPFMPTWPGSHDRLQDHMSTVNVSTLEEPVRIKMCCLHRPGVVRCVCVLSILRCLFISVAIVTICTKLRQACTMEGIKLVRLNSVISLE